MSDAMTDRRGQENEKLPPAQPKAKIIDVWEARIENDQDEGRGGTSPIGYYMSEDHAKHATRDTGVFGTQGPYNRAKVISIDGGKTGWVIDYDKPVVIVPEGDEGMKVQMVENKRAVLAKLRPEDREILGFPADLDNFEG